jgi:hypothetical protein
VTEVAESHSGTFRIAGNDQLVVSCDLSWTRIGTEQVRFLARADELIEWSGSVTSALGRAFNCWRPFSGGSLNAGRRK